MTPSLETGLLTGRVGVGKSALSKTSDYFPLWSVTTGAVVCCTLLFLGATNLEHVHG